MGRLRSLLTQKPKEYTTWEAAAAAAGAYSDPLVNEFRAARTALNIKQGWLPDVLASPLAWLCATLPGHMEITDLGGATGELGVALCQFWPDVTYTVVENPTLVGLMAGADGVRFSTEMPAKCDIFHTSGTLQYLPDPYETFEKAAKSAWLGLAVVRNSFAGREVFTVQESPLHNNGGGLVPDGFPNATIAYPHRTISETLIRTIAASQGFKLVSRIADRPGVPDGHEGYGADLVFLKV